MLVVLLAAAVLVVIYGGREEHREQFNKVEKVNTGKRGTTSLRNQLSPGIKTSLAALNQGQARWDGRVE